MPRLILVLLAVAALAPAAPVPKGVKKEPSYPYAVGTRWEYVRSGSPDAWVEEITESDTADGVTTFKVRITSDGREQDVTTYVLEDGAVSVVSHTSVTYSRPRLLWSIGAAPGTVLETAWQIPAGGGIHAQTETLTVGKPEEITTPAGKFTATPITRTVKGLDDGTVLWYAEGVGLVRHTEPGMAEPVQELKAFTPGKK